MALHPLQATPDYAEAAFGFLSERGFALAKRWVSGGESFKDGWMVSYQSAQVHLGIEYLDAQFDVLFTRGGLAASYFLLDRSMFQRRSGFHGNMFSPEKLADVIDRVATDIRAHYAPILAGDKEAWAEVERICSEPPKGRYLP